MILDISKSKMEKLMDICDKALIILKNENFISFRLENGENITIDDAEAFVEEIFQDLCLCSDD